MSHPIEPEGGPEPVEERGVEPTAEPAGEPARADSPRFTSRDATPPASGAGFVRAGLILYGVFLAAAVIWRVGFYQEPILYASWEDHAAGMSPFQDVLLGLATGALLIGLSDWLTRGTEWGERLARELAATLGAISVADALLLALASGIAEEVFFRGALQPRVGWLAASLLFGLAHFVPRRELLPWTGFAVFAGFLFAGLFIYTGNLIAPICAHVLVNGVNLPLLARRYGPDAADPPAEDDLPGAPPGR